MRTMNERQGGFTLIELLIVITLLAIGIAAAVPSLGEALERRRMTGVLEDVTSRIALARSEAIKRSEEVSVAFTVTAADNWCMGLLNDDTGGCDCTVTSSGSASFCGFTDVNDPSIKLQQRLTAEEVRGVELEVAETFGGDNVFVFDPVTGTLDDLDPGDLVLTSDSGSYEVQITVAPSGLASVCRTANSKVFGGYPACQ